MSRNGKYYSKKIKKIHAEGTLNIAQAFKNACKTMVDESPQPVAQVPPQTPSPVDIVTSPVVEHSNKTKRASSTFKANSDLPSKKRKVLSIDKRKFDSVKYEKEYPWLYFSSTKNGFLCKTCEMFSCKHSNNQAFVTRGVILGTHPGRKLATHNDSKEHQNANRRLILARSNVNVYRQLLMQETAARNQNREAVKKIFQCIDFLIQKKMAFTENTKSLVTFVGKLGVSEIQQHLNNEKQSIKYLSSTCVSEMAICLSDFFERQLLDNLRGKEFSLLADESSDISHRSQLSVMARFEHGRVIETHFLGFVQLEKGTAEHIANALQDFMIRKGIDISLMRFTGFDGCNTMSGIQKGVQRRLTHVNPFSTYVNCRNHRLALCLVHLIKKFPILQDVDSALLSLWKLFEFSPQKFAVFKHIQVVYGKTPLNITKACTTRWLSHLQASARFVSRYVCILDTLDALYAEKREPETYGIRFCVTNQTTVATILLLTDILKPVNMLSLYLQEENVNFTTLPAHVKDTVDQLHDLIASYRQLDNSESEFKRCNELFEEISTRTALERRGRDRDQAQLLTPETYLEQTGIPLIYDLVQEIEDAFNTGDPVLYGFGFLNPMNVPDVITELPNYGENSIQRLVDFYGHSKTDNFQGHLTEAPALFDATQLKTELQSFKTQLFMFRRNGKTTTADVYRAVTDDRVLLECFPNVHKLLYYAMIIPASTAVVERSFSLMGNILTKKRNRLTQRSIDALTRLCHQHNELTNENLETLVDMFKGMKTRKLHL